VLNCYTSENYTVDYTLLRCNCRKLGLEWRWTHYVSSVIMMRWYHWQRLSLKAGKNSWQVQ